MALTARNATRPTDHRACSWRWPSCAVWADGVLSVDCAWSRASGPTSSTVDHFHIRLLHRGDLVRIVTGADHEKDGAHREQRQQEQEGELQTFGATAAQFRREYAEHEGRCRLRGDAGDHPGALAAAAELRMHDVEARRFEGGDGRGE